MGRLFALFLGQALALFLGLAPLSGHAAVREITLFPDVDFGSFAQKDPQTSTARIGLSESILNLGDIPCFITWHQIPLLYRTYQMGPSCAFSLSERHFVLVEFYPEVSVNPSGNQYNFIAGFGDRFIISPKYPAWSLSLALRYKFWDPAFHPPSENVSQSEVFQLWGNVIDSNITIGTLYNEPQTDKRNADFSAFIYFRQSIPLEWRQIGGQKYTAPLQYQQMGVSFRKKYASMVALGIGVSYGNLTLDGLRISGVLPDIYGGIDF